MCCPVHLDRATSAEHPAVVCPWGAEPRLAGGEQRKMRGPQCKRKIDGAAVDGMGSGRGAANTWGCLLDVSIRMPQKGTKTEEWRGNFLNRDATRCRRV